MGTVLVVGASRGIGREFVHQFLAEGRRVLATARRPQDVAALQQAGAQAFALDLLDPASVSGLEWRLDGERLDLAILNAGVYGPRHARPQAPSREQFDEVMHTNVLGAMQLLPQLAGALAPGAKLAVLSSRMGAIGPRTGNAGWLYRASKAALNSVLKDIALELGPRGVCCVALHPGWVQTDMGGAGATLPIPQSVRALRALLASLSPADNGSFRDVDGAVIPW